MFEHSIPLSSSSTNPSPGNFEYLPIQKQYDQQRQVEGRTRGKYLITDVLTDYTSLLDINTV